MRSSIAAAACLAAAMLIAAHPAIAAVDLATYEGNWGDAVAAAAEGADVSGGVTVRRYDGRLSSPALGGADLLDAASGAATFACDEGLARTLPPGRRLTIAGGAAVPGLAHDCGTGYLVTSLVLAAVRDGAADWPSFFDMRGHAGARALPRGPRGTLEIALMARGVPPDQVYAQLATSQGLDSAYAALDALAAATPLYFWDRPDEAVSWLASGTITAAAIPNPDAARAYAEGIAPTVGFDGQIYRVQRMVLLTAQSVRREAALAVMARLLEPERQAALARATGGGPVARAAFNLLADGESGMLPTAPQHAIAERGLESSTDFWARHGNRLAARHADWLMRVETRTQAR